ncbi:MAG: hypothetical protein OEX00_09400 [Gammaproteobacteria bacterium]|nr:hypothetical protein [Gammaproteobacteria bacterium]MDH5692368.1 hypothetical protein [Gammaproteobacteria bacterium]
MKTINVLILFVIMPLSACVSLSPQELRDKTNPLDFTVNQTYQDVFAKVLKQTKQCYLNSPKALSQITVSGDRNNREKTGAIRVTYLYGPTESDTVLLVDVKSLGTDKTQVRAHYSHRWWKSDAQRIRKWVEEGAESCSA